MSGLGDLQACPWCAFVGTPALFYMHMEMHEKSPAEVLVDELTEAKAEIKRLKAQLKLQKQDYAKTLGEMAKAIKFLHDDIESCVQHTIKEKEDE